ncbi:hypothetical protein D3C76_1648270 [compost metagenome]
MEAEIATEDLLFGDPDEARHHGADAQVEVHRHLVAGVVAQGVGQVVADEYLPIGTGRWQHAHAVDFDAHRPGRDAPFGRMGLGVAAAQQQAGGESNGSGA